MTEQQKKRLAQLEKYTRDTRTDAKYLFDDKRLADVMTNVLAYLMLIEKGE